METKLNVTKEAKEILARHLKNNVPNGLWQSDGQMEVHKNNSAIEAVSELLEQNRELVEAATKLAEIQRWVQDNTQRGCENLSALENLEAVLLKHSKDV